jgi:exodeoxyribonuclease VII small subunit
MSEREVRATAPSADALNRLSFEEARKELERIIAQLETGQASLEEALELWERGEELHRICLAKLDAAQGKIEELGSRVEAARP